MKARAVPFSLSLLPCLVAGCGGVDRRFVVESNVPGAQVSIDRQRVGSAPAHRPFEYYGCYTITVSHPDYQTRTERVEVSAPWYAYPPFDFLAEVMWPFRIEDVRRFYFPLEPARRPDVGELVTAADALRERGQNLPPPADPAPPDPPP
ncbi:MAG: PEGA domain-containing protein, partial [Gemmataceae bacterium]|nr:PEGA domain-containing protein [Gemmataceae bacterium]